MASLNINESHIAVTDNLIGNLIQLYAAYFSLSLSLSSEDTLKSKIKKNKCCEKPSNGVALSWTCKIWFHAVNFTITFSS